MLDKRKNSLASKFMALGIVVIFIMSFLGGFACLMQPSKQTQTPAPGSQEANFQEATAQIQAHLEKNQDDVQAWIELGNVYFDWGVQAGDLNMYAAAVDAYGKALELDPKQNDARTDMALAHISLRNTEKAIAELEKVLENDPNHVNALLNLGYANKIAENFSLAAEFWEKFLEIAPQDHPRIEIVKRELEVIKKEITEIKEDTTELENGR
ncbi:MAG TPA: tetratricopeptide repeat protein [Actinobacteria bacterium]|nr:tetratricopeptide repeat protein [Actinomycetota bacterium]